MGLPRLTTLEAAMHARVAVRGTKHKMNIVGNTIFSFATCLVNPHAHVLYTPALTTLEAAMHARVAVQGTKHDMNIVGHTIFSFATCLVNPHAVVLYTPTLTTLEAAMHVRVAVQGTKHKMNIVGNTIFSFATCLVNPHAHDNSLCSAVTWLSVFLCSHSHTFFWSLARRVLKATPQVCSQDSRRTGPGPI